MIVRRARGYPPARCAVQKAQLQQIRLECGKRVGERAAQAIDGPQSCIGDAAADGSVAQPESQLCCQPVHVLDFFGSMRGIERGIDFGKIPDIRPMHDRCAELYGFNRILPPVFDQRATHEDDRGQAIEKTKFPHGVKNIDLGLRLRQLALGARRA